MAAERRFAGRLRDALRSLRAPPGADFDAPAAFPPGGIDGFLSHLLFTVRINTGDFAGQVLSYACPAAIQTVVRSDPFRYGGAGREHRVELALPAASRLPATIAERDFAAVPPDFFRLGAETIFFQIVNLDARGETEFGPLRCLLGETVKREYPELFRPSLGAARSLDGSGLPAALFINPNGIFDTPFGAFRVRPDITLGCRIDAVPPLGARPELLGAVGLDLVEDLRAERGVIPAVPAATLLALAHPLDASLRGEPDELYDIVEMAIARTP